MTEKKELKFEELGRWHNFSVTKWDNIKGNSYTIQIGYKKSDGSWGNKKLTVFPVEIDDLEKCVSIIKEHNNGGK